MSTITPKAPNGFPTYFKPRYEIHSGKYGMYFHDRDSSTSLTLHDALLRLNSLELVKAQRNWYAKKHESKSDDAYTVEAPNGAVADVLRQVLNELVVAKDKWPKWPDDIIHAAGVVNKEAGSLMRAAIKVVYSEDDYVTGSVRKEALQTAATAIRFLQSLNNVYYEHNKSLIHKQD
jgi:hypothetical protein